jgi:hypothetical protein
MAFYAAAIIGIPCMKKKGTAEKHYHGVYKQIIPFFIHPLTPS